MLLRSESTVMNVPSGALQAMRFDRRRFLTTHSFEIQLPCFLSGIGAALIVASNDPRLYWFVPATVLTFITTVVESWVISVEFIRRSVPTGPDAAGSAGHAGTFDSLRAARPVLVASR